MDKTLRLTAFFALAFLAFNPPLWCQEHDHAHHEMTPAEFAELREKIPLYREYTDQQILDSMARMGPNFQTYLSSADLMGEVGVLALGHGYEPSGNEIFKNAYMPTAEKHPTAVGLGMAMMTSAHIQSAVDELTGAGAETLLVIPTTTVQTGGLLQQWKFIFGLQDNAPWMSVARVSTDAEVIFGPTPTTDPLMSAIMLDHALELSRAQSLEVVALVSHGPVPEDDNARELEILEQHAERIRAASDFAEVRGFTLQDDAPSAIRKANVEKLREWVQSSVDDGKRVIVLTTLPVKGSVHKKILRDLEGLNYEFNQKGLMENPRFGVWVDELVASAR